jgi:hypothetical protein
MKRLSEANGPIYLFEMTVTKKNFISLSTRVNATKHFSPLNMVKIKRLESFPKPVATYCVKSHRLKLNELPCPGNTNIEGILSTVDLLIKED